MRIKRLALNGTEIDRTEQAVLTNFGFALLGQLKGGKSATFIVFQTPEEGVGVPVSLNGFGPGVEALP